MRSLPRHGLFGVVLVIAVALRVVAMAGYPALWFEDSFEYVGVAQRMQPYAVRPSGYSSLLWLLRPLHGFAVVTAVQHLLGLSMGVMIYALVRRRASGLPGWAAVLAAAPVLFDAYQIFFEHTILSDVLFSFLVTSAVTIVLWNPRPSGGRVVAAGLLLAAAVAARSIGLVLIPLLVAHLLLVRSNWRVSLAAACAATLPLGGYALWYASWHGHMALNAGSGVWLWARTMPFADCDKIMPPADERVLCPTQPVASRPNSPYFIWSDWSPLRKASPRPIVTNSDLFQPEINDLAGDFARRAILAQPLDYLGRVAQDLGQTFNKRRGPNPNASIVTYNRYAFPNTRSALPDGVRVSGGTVQGDLRDYERGAVEIGFTEPMASVMRTYQTYFFLPGNVLGGTVVLILLAQIMMCAARPLRQTAKNAALPAAITIALVVGPVAVTVYDSRYLLPAVPVMCVALAIMVDGVVRSRRTVREDPSPDPSTPEPARTGH